MGSSERVLDREQLLGRVSHGSRAFLLEAATLRSDVHATARVTLSGDEAYFAGHYDFDPLLPGHILLELFGQLGAVLWSSLDQRQAQVGVLASVERMRILAPVRPPACLDLEARVVDERMGIVWFSCVARLGSRLVGRARFAIAGVERAQ